MKFVAALLVATTSLSIVVAAHADGSGAVVRDATGEVVGPLLNQNNVIAKINRIPYDIEVYQNGLIADANFYFASSDCSGKPLLPYWLIGIPNEQGLLRTAWYQAVQGPFSAGNVFWDVDMSQPEQLSPIGSLWTQQHNSATDKVLAACEVLTGIQSVLAQPATPLNYSVKPPFSVSLKICE